MNLPAELRNKIYQEVLSDPKGHYIIAERRFHRRLGSRVPLNSFKVALPCPNSFTKHYHRQQIFAGVSEEDKEEGWWVTAPLSSIQARLTTSQAQESSPGKGSPSEQDHLQRSHWLSLQQQVHLRGHQRAA